MGNWNGIPIIVDMFMMSRVPDGTGEIVGSRK
jgi:hypothetical protein